MSYYLQLLRFLAACAVIFFHRFITTGNTLVDFYAHKGDFAVSFFFVLSGFVVSNSLLNKPLSFKKYFERRWWKIVPLYLFSLVMVFIIFQSFTVSPFRVFVSAFLLQSVIPAYAMDINFVGWSLSVEFLMYLLLFVLVVKTNVRSKGYKWATWLVWGITQVALMYFFWQESKGVSLVSSNFVYYHPVWHINEFMFGILCAVQAQNMKEVKVLNRKFGIELFILAYTAFVAISFAVGYKLGVDRFYHNGFLAPLTGYFILYIYIAEKSRRDRLQQLDKKYGLIRIFDTLGRMSYSVYLFHIPVAWALRYWMDVKATLTNFTIYFIAVMIFSAFTTFVLEEKLFHKLRSAIKAK